MDKKDTFKSLVAAAAAALVGLAARAAGPNSPASAELPDDVPPAEAPAEDGAAAPAKRRNPSFAFRSEFASGYLSSGGTLGDTSPISTQCLYWRYGLGDYGTLSGYGWTISSLHNRQHDAHHEAFYQFESAFYYGYDWKVRDEFTLRTKAGPLWNPTYGYHDGHNCNWGVHAVQSLDNPYVTPYINWLGMVRTAIRERARIGVEHKFKLCEGFSLTPFTETVWMDSRRYQSRYGGIPQDRFLGGAFATVTTGVVLEWMWSKDFMFFARLRQYDVINSQSRRAVKHQDSYYAKCDWPVLGVGFEYRF